VSADRRSGRAPSPGLPGWAVDLVTLYESHATNHFILHGNVHDRFLLPLGDAATLGSLADFLLRVLMPRFDVVLSYDLGNGIRVEKGEELFARWPYVKETPQLSRSPREAVEVLTRYLRYCANLGRLGHDQSQVGVIVHGAELVAPPPAGALHYDLNALAVLVREWSASTELLQHPLATFLLAENLNDLHPLLVHNPRAARVLVPLPSADELTRGLEVLAEHYPVAQGEYAGRAGDLAQQLAGASLGAVESLLKVKEHAKEPLAPADLVALKRRLVEDDTQGLVEFVQSDKTLNALEGLDLIKASLRQDLVLWQRGDLQALPMGYLFCGPVGTGKTFLVECLAGEAGVPVVKLRNFRDKWVGSTESNLEKIFRLLHALGRCFVFVDEADQALGKREAGPGDSGLSGRVYSMIATEMGNRQNRGRLVWILASSRPDLIEVDLKRPGRIDVKVPIFPASTPEEGFGLLRALCARRGLAIPLTALEGLRDRIPSLLTAGAAESLAVWLYRVVRTEGREPLETLRARLADYQSPVPPDVMDAQLELAIREASDLEFVPPFFRERRWRAGPAGSADVRPGRPGRS